MNPYRLADLAVSAALVASIAALLAVIGPSLDERDMQASKALSDAQAQAAQEYRRDLAAVQVCRSTVGESLVSWTAAGELVCIPRSYMKRSKS
jgi:hypothetical protein